jgi:hypothetical protein
MYNGYIYSKDDVHSPFVKPPWLNTIDNFGRSNPFSQVINFTTNLDWAAV